MASDGLASSLFVTYTVSFKREIINATGAGPEVTGFSNDELAVGNRPVTDRVYSNDMAKVIAFFDRARDARLVTNAITFRYTKKDGTRVCLQTTALPCNTMESPDAVPYLFHTQDITAVHIEWAQDNAIDRKRALAAEAKSQQSESLRRDISQRLFFLEQVLDSAATDNVAFVLDRDSRITQWSSDAERILGYEACTVLNHDITHTGLLSQLQDTQVIVKCAVEDTFRRAASPTRRSGSPTSRSRGGGFNNTASTQESSSPRSPVTALPPSPISPTGRPPSSPLSMTGDLRHSTENVQWTLRCADQALLTFAFQISPYYNQATGSCIGMLVTGQRVKAVEKKYINVVSQLSSQLYEKKDVNSIFHEIAYITNQTLDGDIAAIFEKISTVEGTEGLSVRTAIAFRSPPGTYHPQRPANRMTVEHYTLVSPDRNVVAVNNVAEESGIRFPGKTLANLDDTTEVKSTMVAPIQYHKSSTIHSHVYGVIAVYATREGIVFGDDEIAFLHAISGLLSAVLDLRTSIDRVEVQEDTIRTLRLAVDKEKRKAAQAAKKVGNGLSSTSSTGSAGSSPRVRPGVAPSSRANYAKAQESKGNAGQKKAPRPDPLAPIPGIDPNLQNIICQDIMQNTASESLSWDDIAGLSVAKQALQEMVILPSLYPEVFTGLRSPPRGLLLFGPPGNGKTLLAKILAAQSNSVFFSISASSLTSKWVGEGEKLVRALFAVAKHMQPSIIFIDEIDSILTKRRENEHESSRRLKTEFLVQFDGALTGADDRVTVIGATNRPQELDDAARRRLVKRVYITLPDRIARASLIKRLMRNEPFEVTEEQLEKLVDETESYSCHDLTQLCKDAAYGALRELTMRDSLDQVSKGGVRGITYQDFNNSLGNVRPSVSMAQLSDFKKWNSEFGTITRVASKGAPEDASKGAPEDASKDAPDSANDNEQENSNDVAGLANRAEGTDTVASKTIPAGEGSGGNPPTQPPPAKEV